MTGTATSTQGGLLAISLHPDGQVPPDIARAVATVTPSGATELASGTVRLISWGALRQAGLGPTPIPLCLTSRGPHGDVRPTDLRAGRSDQPIGQLLPPFAALQVTDDHVYAVTDAIGFRHLYLRSGEGWAAVSTSAQALAALAPTQLDRAAIGFQSLLGWQIGDRTLYEGVRKLRDRERVELGAGRARVANYGADQDPRLPRSNATAVPEASALLREYMGQYLDEHPEAVLQLTGGIDSRILLAAIDPARRRGLRALTLAAEPESEDVRIAAELARRNGMEHLVFGFEAVRDLDAADAFRMTLEASQQLQGMADPLAHAALSLVENQAPQGDRISGLGGEVARGFYYVGPPVRMRVSRWATWVLTSWRMFANEAVSEGVLPAAFAKETRELALDEVYRSLAQSQRPWLEATDHFYLYERMQRWAGVTDTAVCIQRAAVNPMLDYRFLEIAASLPPPDKSGSRFLAALLCQLDPELGEIPMDGRKAPRAYVDPSRLEMLTRQSTVLEKGFRKVRQRLQKTKRAPAGGQSLAERVVDHWRAAPDSLDPALRTGFVDERWVAEVLHGRCQPDPSDVAFVMTVVAAQPVVD